MFQKLLACNYVTLWHPKLSIVCPTSPLYYNKHINIHTQRDRSHCCPLWESSQLGFFSSCFVWPSIQNGPLMTTHIIVRAGSPRVDWGSPGASSDSWQQGSIKEQPRPTLKPFIGTRRAEAVWHRGRIKSLARGLNPVETMQVKGGRRGMVSVFLVWAWKKSGSERGRERETWMGKPKLMLECVCWIYTALYPEDNLAAAF